MSRRLRAIVSKSGVAILAVTALTIVAILMFGGRNKDLSVVGWSIWGTLVLLFLILLLATALTLAAKSKAVRIKLTGKQLRKQSQTEQFRSPIDEYYDPGAGGD